MSILEERDLEPSPEPADDAGPETETAKPEGNDSGESTAEPAAEEVPSRITSREEAYRLIERVADYLMVAEPHSPTPYLLKRIARWGEMTLPDLLRETIPGFDDRTRVKESFFIKDEEENDA